MSRPIKFRVWDKQYREWLQQCLFDSPQGFGWCVKCHLHTITLDWILSHPTIWIAQQFTGVKDKNGREIYDGDIVKFSDGRTYKVEWFGAKWDCPGDVSGDCDLSVVSDIVEVIGNILENPELYGYTQPHNPPTPETNPVK